MIALLTLALLAADPAPASGGTVVRRSQADAGTPKAEVPGITAPLGHIGDVVEVPPAGGIDQTLVPVLLRTSGCETQAVYLARMLGGTTRALEQIDGWLPGAPQLDAQLFKGKGRAVLADVVQQLRDARRAPNKLCGKVAYDGGYKLQLVKAPRKWCADKETRSTGDFWFFTGKKPSAVVAIHEGQLDACRPRLSVTLFDSKGVGRLRLDADWGGEMRAHLLGDRCKSVEFGLDAATQTFIPALKSCKR